MRRGGIKATVLVLGLSILGCPRVPEEQPERGGELWVGMMEEPSSLDPLDLTPFGPGELLDLLYLSLCRFDPQGRPTPELARSWEFSEDLRSITYHLRRGVCWWDGKELTGEDLVSAYEALKGHASQLALIERVELLGPYTVRFTARCPYSDFLMDANLKPIPSHRPLELLGNGPYRLDSWLRGDRMVLTANDGFYRGRPPLDRVVIRFFQDPTRMVEEFLADRVDLLFGLPPQFAAQLEGLAESERVVIREPGERYLFVGWNLSHPFLARRSVRLALTMGVDRARLLEEVYLGAGQVVAGPIPPGGWAFDSTLQPLPYDPARAAELLDLEGYRDTDQDGIREAEGRPILLNLLVTPEPERVRIAEELSQSLAQLGVGMRVITLSSGEFLDRVSRGKFDGFLMSWKVSERLNLSPVWHSEGRYNFTGYRVPEVDSLIRLGESQFNRRLARSIWQEFQRRVAEDAPYLFLFAPQRVTVFKPRVRGLRQPRLSQLADCWVPSAQRRVAISPLNPRPWR